MNVIQQLEQEELTRVSANREIPVFAPGDTVVVNVNVVEGTRKRVQAYEGVVIGRRNRGLNSSFVVRKVSSVLFSCIRRRLHRSRSSAAATCDARSCITCATARANRRASAKNCSTRARPTRRQPTPPPTRRRAPKRNNSLCLRSSRPYGGFFFAAMTPADDVDPLTVTPIFEPESVPHDPAFTAADVRGAAVHPDELRVGAIRQRFASPPAWQPELRADVRLFNPERAPRAASVLIPFIVHPHGVCVLLTERTAHLHDHAEQISFPGGRVEDSDADAIVTALREAHEEIGLLPGQVDVVGTLPEYLTATGYKVTPVIGLIEQPFSPVLDAFEVSEVFEVPLAFLMDPINHERRIFQLGEVDHVSRTFYAMPYATPERAADGRRHFIWGATAAILRNLYQFLRA